MTPQQHRCLTYLRDYVAANGVAPSYPEIMDHLNMKSKSGPHRVLTALERKGYVCKEPGAARCYIPTSPKGSRMGSPYSEIERAAIWWLLEAREGMTLPEIVQAVTRQYSKHDIDPGEPSSMTPDDVTVWLVGCWQNYGFHVSLDEVA